MNESPVGGSAFFLKFLILCSFAFLGCRIDPPESPDVSQVRWTTYSDPRSVFSIEYPDVYTIHEIGDRTGVIFRFKGSPTVLVRSANEREGRDHGLWFGKDPVQQINLAGEAGQKFVYNHYDGPAYSRTVSYVIPHRDKFLGLEFRTENTELDDVQQHILSSLRLNGTQTKPTKD